MKLYIKNMVCDRCIRVVREELISLGLQIEKVQLGEVTIMEPKEGIDYHQLNERLIKNGFELLDDRKSKLIEKIKNLVITTIHQKETLDLKINWSDLIAEKLAMDYQYISSLFSTTEGITIEKFIILQRIERIKELIFYGELTISEISYKLGYSSVQHLSSQFRKVTGMTPSEFKKLHGNKRNTLDNVLKNN